MSQTTYENTVNLSTKAPETGFELFIRGLISSFAPAVRPYYWQHAVVQDQNTLSPLYHDGFPEILHTE